MRLGIYLLLATIATAQRISPTTSTSSSIPEPQLPVIDYEACPGKGRSVPDWDIKRNSPVYSTWEYPQTKTGTLKAGEKVTVLAGVNVTRKPDKILVTRSIPQIDLERGDIILRYEQLGEGVVNMWAKGIWHKEYDLSRTTSKDGKTGCLAQDHCDSKVIEDGTMERWVQVKTNRGDTAWMLNFKDTRGVFWDSGNFHNLCAG
jgi:hypothetical protein